jgi:hypothetical protein
MASVVAMLAHRGLTTEDTECTEERTEAGMLALRVGSGIAGDESFGLFTAEDAEEQRIRRGVPSGKEGGCILLFSSILSSILC